MVMSDATMMTLLERIATALERLAPMPPKAVALDAADGFVWHADTSRLAPVAQIAHVGIDLLQGIDRPKALLVENTRRFARGLPANNAMLWGARGTGKSSLVKAAHALVNRECGAGQGRIGLIEIHREEIETLPVLLGLLRGQTKRCIIFCDDLSFEREDAAYKALKSVLDGGIEGRPEHVLFYATSNRRHLMPRDMIENERERAVHASEAVEEKVSLSDRFGLWIGFHNIDQTQYLAMIDGYAAHYRLPIERTALHAAALEWAVTRGARSGRVAWQCVQDVAGQLGVRLEE
jgi:predicted AAA+ superfamily ATPase